MSSAYPERGDQHATEPVPYAPQHGATAYQPASTGRHAVAGDDRSLGEIMSDLTTNLSTLMRQEVALAKAEATQSAKTAGKGAGMLGGAGVAASMALLFLSLGVWWAIAVAIGDHDHPALGWAGLIMMAIWAIIAAILAAAGRSQLKHVSGLEQTKETVQEIPPALKGHEEQNR